MKFNWIFRSNFYSWVIFVKKFIPKLCIAIWRIILNNTGGFCIFKHIFQCKIMFSQPVIYFSWGIWTISLFGGIMSKDIISFLELLALILFKRPFWHVKVFNTYTPKLEKQSDIKYGVLPSFLSFIWFLLFLNVYSDKILYNKPSSYYTSICSLNRMLISQNKSSVMSFAPNI